MHEKGGQHYKIGDIQPIDFMRENFTKEQFEGMCLGNAMKYLSRYNKKEGVNGRDDLHKAIHYIEFLLETLEVEHDE